jgi:diguanylate cyclase (GGDEF)-like protein
MGFRWLMLIYDVLPIVGCVIIIIICYRIYRSWIQLHQKVNYLNNVLELVENSKDIAYYCEIKPKFQYKYLSSSIEKVLRPNLVEESMKNPYTAFELVHPEDYDILSKKISGELDYSKPIIVRWRNDKGEYIWFEENSTPIYKNGDLVAIQGIIRNIDEKMKLQEELEYKVSHDTLTDLYNREYFELQIEKYDKNADVSIGIVICDLNNLKFVNDTQGHKVGDRLIKVTAELLNIYSNDKIIVARIGGDEFAILLIDTNPFQIDLLLENITNSISNYNGSRDGLFKISLSKGYSNNYSSIGNMEELFIEADNNMYSEKNNRKLLSDC